MFNKKLKEKIKTLESKLSKAIVKTKDLEMMQKNYDLINNKNAKLLEENEKIIKEFNDLKKQLREQNEADLLLVSEKIKKDILNGKKEKEMANLKNERTKLQKKMIDLRNYNHYSFEAQRSNQQGRYAGSLLGGIF